MGVGHLLLSRVVGRKGLRCRFSPIPEGFAQIREKSGGRDPGYARLAAAVGLIRENADVAKRAIAGGRNRFARRGPGKWSSGCVAASRDSEVLGRRAADTRQDRPHHRFDQDSGRIGCIANADAGNHWRRCGYAARQIRLTRARVTAIRARRPHRRWQKGRWLLSASGRRFPN